MDTFSYHAPTAIRFGAGVMDELGRHIRRAEHVCVVTGRKSAEASGLRARIEKLLREAGVAHVVFGAASPNPPCTEVDAIAQRARDMKCQLVIGVGGGSAMDAAKGVAVGAANSAPVADLIDTDWPYRALPLLMIPTTAGTGSEVNQYAILTDERIDDKANLHGPDTYPYLALLDPELTLDLPVEYTVDTGVDAFCHAVEGYISRRATPLSDALAIEAITRVRHALPKVVKTPRDIEARGEMLYAACVAGLVIAQAGTTMVHALGYHLTLKHGVSHGRANAALIAHGLDFNYEAAAGKIGRVYELFGGAKDRTGVEALDAWLDALGVATSLADYGVTVEEITQYAAYVMTKGNTKSSPRVVSAGDVEQLLRTSL
ncbi:MAG: iron-containing alcohol dehydrogenase [Verrucomicrobia bacterium]|nr:iron-containing alcohol dehydrogenase [Verrucomicrobiota bacterium]